MASDSYEAGVLAARIEAYWRGRGFAGISVQRQFDERVGGWVLLSNIGPTGYPPRGIVS